MGISAPYEIQGIQTGPVGRRYPHGAEATGFDPHHLCLVYLKFTAADVVIRHAYFPATSQIEEFAAWQFSSVASAGQWATSPLREEVNFENFTFGSQQLIIFHIDPAGASVQFDPENLVQFAEWSARGVKTPATRRARNNCFLNPAIRCWSGIDVLTLENWFVDDEGRPIAEAVELLYTMNLHALMRFALGGSSADSQGLPLILDPDTGNGTGNEP